MNSVVPIKIKCTIKSKLPECSICLDKINTPDICTTECNHAFHRKCIITWHRGANEHCPLCRGTTGLYQPNGLTADMQLQLDAAENAGSIIDTLTTQIDLLRELVQHLRVSVQHGNDRYVRLASMHPIVRPADKPYDINDYTADYVIHPN